MLNHAVPGRISEKAIRCVIRVKLELLDRDSKHLVVAEIPHEFEDKKETAPCQIIFWVNWLGIGMCIYRK